MGHDWDGYINLLEAARMNDHCRIYCANHRCDHDGQLEYRPLIDRHGPHIGLGPILRKLRCARCGSLGAFPIMEPGTKEHPAKPIYCAIHTDKPHPCDRDVAGKEGGRLDDRNMSGDKSNR